MNDKDLLEKLAELEHEQWMTWAKKILETENISIETRTRWAKYFVPYSELSEEVKELDLSFAQKSFNIFKKYLQEGK